MVLVLLALNGQSWCPGTRLVFMRPRKIPVLLEDAAVSVKLVADISKWKVRLGLPISFPDNCTRLYCVILRTILMKIHLPTRVHLRGFYH